MANPLMVAGNTLGSRNAAEYQRFRHKLKQALARSPQALGRIADKLVEKALEGEQWAVQMVADRLDGKAKEHIHIEHTQSYGSLESIQAEIAKAIEERAQQLLEARSVVAVQHKPEEPPAGE